MEISVIIPVYKDWARLAICLMCLQNQSIRSEDWEIVIVNNAPDDSPPSNFLIPDNAILIDQAKAGSYAARNTGILHSKGEVLAFLDSDCIPDSDWLLNASKLLDQEVELVGGKMEFFKEKEGSELVFQFEKAFSFDQKGNVANGQSITANLFVKRNVFDVVGFFPESFLSGGDFFWTNKASKHFKLVYGKDVVVRHPARLSISSLKKKKKRTAGGMYLREFQSLSFLQSLIFVVKQLRPPLTIFLLNRYSMALRVRFFFLKWYLEWIGIQEMMRVKFANQKMERN